jgi:hypothetical protein
MLLEDANGEVGLLAQPSASKNVSQVAQPIFTVLPLSAHRFHCVKDPKNCHFWGNKGYPFPKVKIFSRKALYGFPSEKDPKRCLLPQPSVQQFPATATIGLSSSAGPDPATVRYNKRGQVSLLPQPSAQDWSPSVQQFPATATIGLGFVLPQHWS